MDNLKKVDISIKTLPLFIAQLEKVYNCYLYDGTFKCFECYNMDYSFLDKILPTTTKDTIVGNYRFIVSCFTDVKELKSYIRLTSEIMDYKVFVELVEDIIDNQ